MPSKDVSLGSERCLETECATVLGRQGFFVVADDLGVAAVGHMTDGAGLSRVMLVCERSSGTLVERLDFGSCSFRADEQIS